MWREQHSLCRPPRQAHPGPDPQPAREAGARARKAASEAFVLAPLAWAAGALGAANTPGAMVVLLLAYLAWKTGSTTFSLSNTLSAQYGVNRETNRRVLANLEKAGWIHVQRSAGRSPRITLLITPKRTRARALSRRRGRGCHVGVEALSRRRTGGPSLHILFLVLSEIGESDRSESHDRLSFASLE
jgi:DNA-binding MarR family transcriptional regulator